MRLKAHPAPPPGHRAKLPLPQEKGRGEGKNAKEPAKAGNPAAKNLAPVIPSPGAQGRSSTQRDGPACPATTVVI